MFNAGWAVRQALAAQATVSMRLSDLAGPNASKLFWGARYYRYVMITGRESCSPILAVSISMSPDPQGGGPCGGHRLRSIQVMAGTPYNLFLLRDKVRDRGFGINVSGPEIRLNN